MFTKGGEVSSAERDSSRRGSSLSPSDPSKHLYFLMCYCAHSQRRLILQAEQSLLCCARFYYLFTRLTPSFLNKTVPNLTFGGEDRIDSCCISSYDVSAERESNCPRSNNAGLAMCIDQLHFLAQFYCVTQQYESVTMKLNGQYTHKKR